MTFLIPLALLIAAFAVFPLLAHALRRGRASPHHFPATRFVPSRTTTARQRHRLEDRWLLLLRILLLACLALLAATPFVKCSRLSLGRTDGASVAAALVIDDSASMRAKTAGGSTRLEAALEGARQLLGTARSGDSFSIVLAGHPARVHTSTTTELGSVRDALDTIRATDRKTDIASALDLARSLQEEVPQSDRPIVLLSDLSIPEASSLDLEGVILPEAGLRSPMENCALVSAVMSPDAVQTEITCTSENAIKGRKLQLFDTRGTAIGSAVAAQDGAVRLPLARKDKKAGDKKAGAKKESPNMDALEVRLTTSDVDDIEDDDRCVVIDSPAALSVGIRADQGTAGVKTGAGTVLQAAVEALDRGVRVQSLSLLPEDPRELEPLSALLIDDPSGFVPEVREAVTTWTEQGGVGLVLLGPAIARAPLGSDFAPFLRSSPSWKATTSSGADPSQAGALGPLTTGWVDLGARHRATWAEDDAQTLARWDDGSPLVSERALGRGLLLTVSLPSSVDESDLALRPAFLELLDYAISQSAIRRGARATPVGERWGVDPTATVTGPDGSELAKQPFAATEGTSTGYSDFVEPELAGRYTITHADEEATSRVAMRDLSEHVTQPSQTLGSPRDEKRAQGMARVGISREIALLTLVLGAIELAFRMLARTRRRSPLREGIS